MFLIPMEAWKAVLNEVPTKLSVLDPNEGVCADPVERVAILEVKGPGPPDEVSECQLSPDRGDEKT
jgi:hypothetical protein